MGRCRAGVPHRPRAETRSGERAYRTRLRTHGKRKAGSGRAGIRNFPRHRSHVQTRAGKPRSSPPPETIGSAGTGRLAVNNSRLYRLFPASIALLSLIPFLSALRNDFVDWDDGVNFIDNTSFRGLGFTQLHWMWTSHLLNRYIPITWMTFGLDYNLWGLDPFGFHLTNLLWHTANAVLFYFLAVALLRRAIP